MVKTCFFGGGCFWCTEAVFKNISGVISVFPGYMGGEIKNPTYEQVCEGYTGHAEIIKIEYESSKISFKDLLYIFFSTHDPTTLNRQGNDLGTQYRSSVFTNDDSEIEILNNYILELNNSTNKEIVTTIERVSDFYIAEDYHHNYFNLNKNAPYCSVVIEPKIKKLMQSGNPFLKN
jgi:peptide-methionine (S)-S-oxide reductase